jgi:hypothetical protein
MSSEIEVTLRADFINLQVNWPEIDSTIWSENSKKTILKVSAKKEQQSVI